MSKLSVLALAGLVLGSLLMSTSPAFASWGFEDPQLCVNGRLLTVIPAGPSDVYVKVPTGTLVDFNVANCGGTELPVLESHVRYSDDLEDKLVVRAKVPSGTVVYFTYDGVTKSKTSDDGAVKAKFELN